MKSLENLTVVEGHARFESARTVRVGDRVFEAGKIFINVGGRASIPAVPGLDTIPFLTNSSMLDVDLLPEHLIILGGSYIGLEFGQMYRRFGSRVTIIEMAPRVIGRENDDIPQTVAEILTAEGVEIHTNSQCLNVEKKGDQLSLSVDCDATTGRIDGTHLLVAAGRTPNTQDLGLERSVHPHRLQRL